MSYALPPLPRGRRFRARRRSPRRHRRRGHPQDQARRRGHAGEPLVRQLLRHLSRRRRDRDARRQAGGLRPRSQGGRVPAAVPRLEPRQPRRAAHPRRLRGGRRRRQDGRGRGDRGGRVPRGRQQHSRLLDDRRHGLPRCARDPELLELRPQLRPPGPHVRSGGLLQRGRAPVHGVGLVRPVLAAVRPRVVQGRRRRDPGRRDAPRDAEPGDAVRLGVAGPALRLDRHHLPASRPRRELGLLRRRRHDSRLPGWLNDVRAAASERPAPRVLEPAAELRHCPRRRRAHQHPGRLALPPAGPGGNAAPGVLGDPQRCRQRPSGRLAGRRPGLRHHAHQRGHVRPGLGLDRDLPDLGRLGRLLRPRRSAQGRRIGLRPAVPRLADQPVRAQGRDRPPDTELRCLSQVHRGRLSWWSAARPGHRRPPRPAPRRPRERQAARRPAARVRLQPAAPAAADPGYGYQRLASRWLRANLVLWECRQVARRPAIVLLLAALALSTAPAVAQDDEQPCPPNSLTYAPTQSDLLISAIPFGEGPTAIALPVTEEEARNVRSGSFVVTVTGPDGTHELTSTATSVEFSPAVEGSYSATARYQVLTCSDPARYADATAGPRVFSIAKPVVKKNTTLPEDSGQAFPIAKLPGVAGRLGILVPRRLPSGVRHAVVARERRFTGGPPGTPQPRGVFLAFDGSSSRSAPPQIFVFKGRSAAFIRGVALAHDKGYKLQGGSVHVGHFRAGRFSGSLIMVSSGPGGSGYDEWIWHAQGATYHMTLLVRNGHVLVLGVSAKQIVASFAERA